MEAAPVAGPSPATRAEVLNARLAARGAEVADDDADDHHLRVTRYTGVNPPIALTTNYHWPTRQDELEGNYFYYSRSDNPNYLLLEHELTRLHHGSSAVVFATGMAAISAVLLSLVRKDKAVVRANEIYNDVPRLLQEMTEMSGTEVITVDICDTEAVIKSVEQENVRVLYFESASNPNSFVPDFDELIRRSKEVNPQCLVVVDNTFLSPIHFRPLDHGADIVIESGTKYLSGKGDVLLGAVVFRKKQADQGDMILTAMTQRVKRWRSVGGGSPSPMSCWLVSKGLETLRLRMHHATATALEVARFLETVPCLTRVVFPGLASHPCHARAIKYFGEKNSGAVLRFHLSLYGPTVDQMLTDPHPFMHAVSLGESHTLLYPVPGESRLFPEDAEREVPDFVGYWFRVAIGLETAEDIISGFLHLFARQDVLVAKVGEVKKFDAKTRQMSFRGKLPSSCPYLFFFAGETGGKGQRSPAQSPDGQGTRRAIFIERVACDEEGGGKAAKKGKATVSLGLASAADEKALLIKGTALFCFKSALALYTELVRPK